MGLAVKNLKNNKVIDSDATDVYLKSSAEKYIHTYTESLWQHSRTMESIHV